MFQHFLKIAYRNFLRRKVYSVINVLGLAIGMACCLLITHYVLHELSYDKYHKNGDRIFRVIHAYGDPGSKVAPQKEDYQVWGNAPVGAALIADFPEVESLVQFTSPNTMLLQYGDKRYQQDNLLFMDSTVFSVFTWKLLEGDAKTALKAPNSIVLTKTIADKLFGAENAVGKTLRVDNYHNFLVTGVMEDVPSNSHFNFSGLISMTTFRGWRSEIFSYWGYVDFYTYFIAKKGTTISSLNAKVPQLLAKHNKESSYTMSFERLHDAYMHSKATRQPGITGSLPNVYIFSFVALFILVIACINFMNLSTARSMERAREVGVRKVLGAQSPGLVRQFLAESVFMSLLAGAIALLLSRLAHPLVTELSGKTFTTISFYTPQILLLVLLAAVITGLLSGIYPALFLSRFRTISVLKGASHTGTGGGGLRKALVVFQFTLSMALIAGTGIVYAQLEHLRNRDLGFEKDQMLVIDFAGDEQVQQKMRTIKSVIKQHPSVISATASRAVPGEFLPNAHTEIQGPGGEMKAFGPLLYEIDDDFIQDYKIEMAAGRPYSNAFPADTMKSMIINEAAAKQFGYTNPSDAVGKKFSQWGREGTVIGVVKDFNFRSLRQPIEPLTLRFAEPYALNYLSVRIKQDNIQQTITDLKQSWDKIAPQRPFLYKFLDESFYRQYKADVHFGKIFALFSALAIFIACLGLFALATFTAEQRTKEIGIRKVLGSSVTGIVALISKDFITLMLIAIVIAVPICWYAMTQWLNDFPYRTQISPMIFVKSGLIAMLVAMFTISWQSVKAALANPVHSLRDE